MFRGIALVCVLCAGTALFSGCSEDNSGTGPEAGMAIASDATVRAYGGHVYVLERFGADNVLKYDPSVLGSAAARLFVAETDFQSGLLEWVDVSNNTVGTAKVEGVVYQTHLGDNWNPSDIEFVSDTKAYVSNQNVPSITVFNPSTGTATGQIDISAYTFNPDSNTSPNANQMALVDTTLYVMLQRRNGWDPGGTTLILAVNTTTDSVAPADTIACQYQNGYDMAYVSGALYITNPGSNYMVGDGAIERVDLATGRVTTVATEDELGGSPNQIAHTSGSTFYVQNYIGWQSVSVVELDASSGTIVDTLPGVKDAFGGIFFDPVSGSLYVGELDSAEVGVKVFEDNVQTAGPLTSSISLPPASMVMVR